MNEKVVSSQFLLPPSVISSQGPFPPRSLLLLTNVNPHSPSFSPNLLFFLFLPCCWAFWSPFWASVFSFTKARVTISFRSSTELFSLSSDSVPSSPSKGRRWCISRDWEETLGKYWPPLERRQSKRQLLGSTCRGTPSLSHGGGPPELTLGNRLQLIKCHLTSKVGAGSGRELITPFAIDYDLGDSLGQPWPWFISPGVFRSRLRHYAWHHLVNNLIIKVSECLETASETSPKPS